MVNETLRLGKYLVYITDEIKSTKFVSIEKRKNSRVSGARELSFIGHISESDFISRPSAFAPNFLDDLYRTDYDLLRDKVLSYSYKLPRTKYIHAMVYRIDG